MIVRLIRFGEALFSLEIMAMSGRVGRQMERRTAIQFLFGWIAERYRTQSHSAFFFVDRHDASSSGGETAAHRKEGEDDMFNRIDTRTHRRLLVLAGIVMGSLSSAAFAGAPNHRVRRSR